MDLKTRAIKSTAWFVATRLWVQALSWGVTLILARLLAPQDYGLFAMAFTVVTFLDLFQEFGLGVSIVQRQNIDSRQINAVFWLLSAVSIVVVTMIFALAEYAAVFYDEPRLTWIVRALSLTFLFNSLGVIPYSLLTKEIDFKGRSIAEAAGVVTSSGISLSLAYWGYGVWALIWGQLARACVRTVAMYVCSKWSPGLQISLAELREILHFSLRVAGASTLGTLSETFSNAIVGRFLGGYTLGLYTMSTTLGQNNPLHKLSTGVINQLSLPIFSNLQHETGPLRDYFLKITKYLAAMSFPMQLGMVFVAHDLVSVLLSEKWLPIVELVRIFAIGGIFHIVTLPSYPLLTARGRADLNLSFAWVSLVLMTFVYLLGAQWGLRGVAIGWLILFPSIRIYLLRLGLNEISLSWRTYFANVASPSFASGVMIAALFVTNIFTLDLLPFERLCVTVGVGSVAYISFLFVIDKTLTREVSTIARSVFATSHARHGSRA